LFRSSCASSGRLNPFHSSQCHRQSPSHPSPVPPAAESCVALRRHGATAACGGGVPCSGGAVPADQSPAGPVRSFSALTAAEAGAEPEGAGGRGAATTGNQSNVVEVGTVWPDRMAAASPTTTPLPCIAAHADQARFRFTPRRWIGCRRVVVGRLQAIGGAAMGAEYGCNGGRQYVLPTAQFPASCR
jgi:hypothetical protein